jgi:hypothetical protein
MRCGASVTLRSVSGERAGEERSLEIVGIDEADAAHGRVAFTAPIARAILGREVGKKAAVDTPRDPYLLAGASIADKTPPIHHQSGSRTRGSPARGRHLGVCLHRNPDRPR